jgi:hypothetical protein
MLYYKAAVLSICLLENQKKGRLFSRPIFDRFVSSTFTCPLSILS